MNSDTYVSTIQSVFTGAAPIEAIAIISLAVLALGAVVLMARAPRSRHR